MIMHPFDYAVSFHVSHPSLDPRRITAELGMRPQGAYKAGDPRKTPAGTPLKGFYADSHWYCDFPHRGGVELGAFLESVVERLAGHRKFLMEVCARRGSLWLFVAWYSGANSGETFSWALLKRLADLKIDLSLDVYAETGRAARSFKARPTPLKPK